MNATEKRIASRYIPKGSTKILVKGTSVIVYVNQVGGAWYGIAYCGTAGKPAWNYRFKKQESLAGYIKEWGETLKRSAKYSAERKAARLSFQHSLEVGDVLKALWGYDQTNIDFYEVVNVIGKYVEIREIAQESKETDWCQGKCIPILGSFISEPMKRKVSEGNGVNVDSVRWARKVEPKIICGAKVYGASHWTSYA